MRVSKLNRYLPYPRTNGVRGHPLYKIWNGMIYRCYCTYSRDYKYYGKLGITVAQEFFNFNVFIKYLGDRPSLSHTIDRIDGTKGYEPDNLRWETKRNQVLNRRMGSHNTSGYRGVTWREDRHLWVAQISVKSKLISLGQYSTKEEAALAYNTAAVKYNGKNAKLNVILTTKEETQC